MRACITESLYIYINSGVYIIVGVPLSFADTRALENRMACCMEGTAAATRWVIQPAANGGAECLPISVAVGSCSVKQCKATDDCDHTKCEAAAKTAKIANKHQTKLAEEQIDKGKSKGVSKATKKKGGKKAKKKRVKVTGIAASEYEYDTEVPIQTTPPEVLGDGAEDDQETAAAIADGSKGAKNKVIVHQKEEKHAEKPAEGEGAQKVVVKSGEMKKKGGKWKKEDDTKKKQSKRAARDDGAGVEPLRDDIPPFAELDKDDSNSLSKEEVRAQLLSNLQMVDGILKANPKIDYDALVGALEDMAVELFEEVDTNNSGEIERKEYYVLLRGKELDEFTNEAGSMVMGAMVGTSEEFLKKPESSSSKKSMEKAKKKKKKKKKKTKMPEKGEGAGQEPPLKVKKRPSRRKKSILAAHMTRTVDGQDYDTETLTAGETDALKRAKKDMIRRAKEASDAKKQGKAKQEEEFKSLLAEQLSGMTLDMSKQKNKINEMYGRKDQDEGDDDDDDGDDDDDVDVDDDGDDDGDGDGDGDGDEDIMLDWKISDDGRQDSFHYDKDADKWSNEKVDDDGDDGDGEVDVEVVEEDEDAFRTNTELKKKSKKPKKKGSLNAADSGSKKYNFDDFANADVLDGTMLEGIGKALKGDGDKEGKVETEKKEKQKQKQKQKQKKEKETKKKEKKKKKNKKTKKKPGSKNQNKIKASVAGGIESLSPEKLEILRKHPLFTGEKMVVRGDANVIETQEFRVNENGSNQRLAEDEDDDEEEEDDDFDMFGGDFKLGAVPADRLPTFSDKAQKSTFQIDTGKKRRSRALILASYIATFHAVVPHAVQWCHIPCIVAAFHAVLHFECARGHWQSALLRHLVFMTSRNYG